MPGYKFFTSFLLTLAAIVGLGIGPQTLGTGALTLGLCIAGKHVHHCGCNHPLSKVT